MFQTILHNNIDAINQWHDDHAIIGTLIGIFSIVAPTIISILAKLPIWQSILLFLGIAVAFLIYFFDWKKNNFYLTKLGTQHLLIIKRPAEHLFIELDQIIIPEDDVLRLTMNLNFDQFLKKELESQGKYVLVFKKPKNLDITYLKTEKTKYKIINEGISDTLYSICFDFGNNDVDEHQFDLEADIKTNGDLEIYLISEKELENIEDIISKKSPITTEKIFSTKVTTDL
jgi:hypothetical protein